MKQVVVVGGGISGLVTAYRLQQRPSDLAITLLEEGTRLGGTIWTEQQEGFRLEIGPNGFLDTRPTTLDLCRDLGVADHLVAASENAGRNRYLFWKGELRPLPNGVLAFTNSRLLGWGGKLGLLLERFRRSRPHCSDESVAAFARRRAGQEVADVLADAIVTGIHAGDPELLSVRATFPRLADFEQQYGSVLRGFKASARQRRKEATVHGQSRGTHMWSFPDGLGHLIEEIAHRLTRPPVLGVTVRQVEPTSDGSAGWRVLGTGQDSWPADAVVLACPAFSQAAILRKLDAELAERIGSIPYNRLVVMGLGYRREDVPMSVDGFGFIVPQRLRRDVLGVQWCSSIFPERAPPGMVLLRAMSGGWNRPEMVDWEDDRLLAAVRAELHLTMGITAMPAFHRVVRWPRAIPQYHVGHLDRVAWIEDRVRRYPGLFVGGNAYRGVALNDCTEQASLLAGTIHNYLHTAA